MMTDQRLQNSRPVSSTLMAAFFLSFFTLPRVFFSLRSPPLAPSMHRRLRAVLDLCRPPILHLQSRHARELARVRRRQRGVAPARLRSNEDIIGSDRRAN